MISKTLPIFYEVCYQTKFKKQVSKSKRMAKKSKIKRGESLRAKLQTL
ncbi:hypothetical protein N199_03740 [Helicobacter pylori UM038]|uniref:Transposase n=1 Tax=Helicobacter pylori UM038 TaxID=1352343 RepID=A0AAV3JNS9_HELPX|nr:hypothetical protein N199_03740 [Helicobacter pylori UM038]